jgi:exodeoxyribonuclease-3
MEIATWNVNGYRAARKKGLAEWVQNRQPDIVCLQEIKVRPEQIIEADRTFPGYLSLWNPANRPGYSGVATFLRREAVGVEFGIGEDRFDCEGRVIQSAYPGFHLFNIYFPNGQRGQERLGFKLDFYARLLELSNQLHSAGKQIILTGDFNTAHNEIDLANPKENSTTSGFLPEERRWIDQYLASGFVDAYRELYPERVEYTWWTYRFGARTRNIGWRLDFFLVSSSLMDRVEEVQIHAGVDGSDHCPVTLKLTDG